MNFAFPLGRECGEQFGFHHFTTLQAAVGGADLQDRRGNAGKTLAADLTSPASRPAVPLRGPPHESDLGDQRRPDPLPLDHLLGCDAAAPVRGLAVERSMKAPRMVSPRVGTSRACGGATAHVIYNRTLLNLQP